MPKTERAGRAAPAGGAEPRTDGLGRVLITVYLILALAATLRGVYQIIAKFDEVPVAYSLSLASGIVYILATVALMKRTGVWRVIAWAALVFEFAGVLIVGTLSLLVPAWFAHDSVWSFFGMNYFWIPLVLPALGMIWLRRESRENRVGRAADSAPHPMTEPTY